MKRKQTGEIIYKEESYNIIGACIEVHKTLGCGFLEPVYQRALEEEFKLQKIPFVREKAFDVFYKDINLNKTYVTDFVYYDKIILELKALPELTKEHHSQVINYLKLTDMKLGIIANFGKSSFEQQRIPNKFHRNLVSTN
jgi:GxxExxY protein